MWIHDVKVHNIFDRIIILMFVCTVGSLLTSISRLILENLQC